MNPESSDDSRLQKSDRRYLRPEARKLVVHERKRGKLHGERTAASQLKPPVAQKTRATNLTTDSKPKINSTLKPAKVETNQKFVPHPMASKNLQKPNSNYSIPTNSKQKNISKPIGKPQFRRAMDFTKPVQPKQTEVATNNRPASVIKQQAISEAMERPRPAQKQDSTRKQIHKKTNQPRNNSKFSQKFSMAAASLAIVMLGGYFTYLYLPNISVRVAASQSGVNATYPSYHPSGYSLSGPIAFNDGEVKMSFVANAADVAYEIRQTESNWDSSAVRDNFVKPKQGDNFITSRENGLTIFTYGKKAAWVNKGVMYTISGDAPLSGEQIRRIALSM